MSTANILETKIMTGAFAPLEHWRNAGGGRKQLKSIFEIATRSQNKVETFANLVKSLLDTSRYIFQRKKYNSVLN